MGTVPKTLLGTVQINIGTIPKVLLGTVQKYHLELSVGIIGNSTSEYTEMSENYRELPKDITVNRPQVLLRT